MITFISILWFISLLAAFVFGANFSSKLEKPATVNKCISKITRELDRCERWRVRRTDRTIAYDMSESQWHWYRKGVDDSISLLKKILESETF